MKGKKASSDPAFVRLDTPNWYGLLTRKRGEVAGNAANVITALSNDPEWKGVLGYNTFIGDIEAMKAPPWRGDLAPAGAGPTGSTYKWSDQDTTRCAAWLARRHGIDAPEWVVNNGLLVVAEQRRFHPVRDCLNELTWDGEERVNSWLIRHAGAEDNHYTRAVTAKWMIGLVARVFNPGCMFRMMLILEGPQDIRKSTAFRTIAMRDEWFMETTIDMGSKDAYQTLRGKWLVEFAELDSFGRAETAKVKQYISERVSTYRPSYGRRSVDHLRQCGFGGTVNPDGGGYLKDSTGATRFHPIKVTRAIDIEGLVKEREQLWAEALVRYKRGELPFLDNDRVKAAAARVAEERRQVDPWEDPVGRFLARLSPRRVESGVTTYEALTQAVAKEAGHLTHGDQIRMGKVLQSLKWELAGRPRVGAEDGRPRVYRPTVGAITGHTGPTSDRPNAKNKPKTHLVQLVQLVQTDSEEREEGSR